MLSDEHSPREAGLCLDALGICNREFLRSRSLFIISGRRDARAGRDSFLLDKLDIFSPSPTTEGQTIASSLPLSPSGSFAYSSRPARLRSVYRSILLSCPLLRTSSTVHSLKIPTGGELGRFGRGKDGLVIPKTT